MSRRPRERGSVEKLPSGSVRVRVYAGEDPVTKRRHDLFAVVKPGPKQAAEVRKAKSRLVSQVEERRNPRTNATVNQLLERYLDQFDGAPATLTLYRKYVKRHVAPYLGTIKVGDLDADILDSFYAELRRCRRHCSGRPYVEHRTQRQHECDDRCTPHRCRPLGATTIRHMHFLLSGAFRRAMRWRWVSANPVSQATPPAAPAPKPEPPSAEDAARIVNEAWRDPDWGTFIWLAMTAGARRGELCALRWLDVDLDPEGPVLWLRRAVKHGADGWVEGDTKTHQQRRVALDPKTAAVLDDHRERCRSRAESLGIELDHHAYVFSPAPDGSSFVTPDSVTQRYDRLVRRLGIDTTFHKLRHYSATALIGAGVDVRTVAGRLGHSGGGTTTLRTYAAWLSEADQRAARGLLSRVPDPPPELDEGERAKADPRSPYERIAAGLREDIVSGAFADGSPVPTEKEIAARHQVAIGTAHRAMTLLKTWGLIESRPGRRPQTRRGSDPPPSSKPIPQGPANGSVEPTEKAREFLDLTLVRGGVVVREFSAEADPRNPAELRRLLLDAVSRARGHPSQVGDYEMQVRRSGERDLIRTFATLP
ncbi:MAG: tyrosine-type recombinase/integrase [Streptosporangiaceae bacterium]